MQLVAFMYVLVIVSKAVILFILFADKNDFFSEKKVVVYDYLFFLSFYDVFTCWAGEWDLGLIFLPI